MIAEYGFIGPGAMSLIEMVLMINWYEYCTMHKLIYNATCNIYVNYIHVRILVTNI